MKLIFGISLAVVFGVSNDFAFAMDDQGNYVALGTGLQTCKESYSSQAAAFKAKIWLEGFFTAINLKAKGAVDITKVPDRFQFVTAFCNENPNLKLSDAANAYLFGVKE